MLDKHVRKQGGAVSNALRQHEIDFAFAGERSTARGHLVSVGIGRSRRAIKLHGNSVALQPNSPWRFAMWAASLKDNKK